MSRGRVQVDVLPWRRCGGKPGRGSEHKVPGRGAALSLRRATPYLTAHRATFSFAAIADWAKIHCDSCGSDLDGWLALRVAEVGLLTSPVVVRVPNELQNSVDNTVAQQLKQLQRHFRPFARKVPDRTCWWLQLRFNRRFQSGGMKSVLVHASAAVKQARTTPEVCGFATNRG